MEISNRQNRKYGIFLVLTAGISWGILGIFVRMLVSCGLTPVDICAMRSSGTALIIAVISLIFFRETYRIKLRDLWCMAGCGILSITVFNICYFAAIRHTTMNIAVVLLYPSPAFVMLMSRFCFKEKFSLLKILSLISVLAGCVLVSGAFSSGGRLSPRILLLGLGAGFCYALYTIFGRFAQQKGYGSIAIILWTFIFAGSAGVFMLDWSNVCRAALNSSGQFMIAVTALILLTTILPYWSYTAGLKRLTPSSSAIAATVEPLVSTLIGVVLYGEILTAGAVAGMVLILGAVLLCRK